MLLSEEIKKMAASRSISIREAQGLYNICVVVAERKSYISKQKLEYRARFRINEPEKVVKFTETLQESKVGIAFGSVTSGVGLKAEAFNLHALPAKVSIEDQSTLFEERYNYYYDFSSIRDEIEAMTGRAGYCFKYQLTPVGI